MYSSRLGGLFCPLIIHPLNMHIHSLPMCMFRSYLMCDCDASFVIVSLYHINSEQLTDRGSILILNPYLANVVYVKRSDEGGAAAEKKEVLSFKKHIYKYRSERRGREEDVSSTNELNCCYRIFTSNPFFIPSHA
jgi:hypothetical protein